MHVPLPDTCVHLDHDYIYIYELLFQTCEVYVRSEAKLQLWSEGEHHEDTHGSDVSRFIIIILLHFYRTIFLTSQVIQSSKAHTHTNKN